MTFKRIVQARPAWGKVHTDPAKNYGIHSMEILWYLVGPAGAVGLSIGTGLHLPSVRARSVFKDTYQPEPNGVFHYHSPVPLYEEHAVSKDPCEYLGVPCYSGSAYSYGNELGELLVAEGSEALWHRLIGAYDDKFGRGQLIIPEIQEEGEAYAKH